MSVSIKNSREKTRRHRAQVAAFGAALGALAVGQATPAEAAVIDLTSFIDPQINSFGGYASLGLAIDLGPAGFFNQFNDSYGKQLSGNFGGMSFVSARASSILTSDRQWGGFLDPGVSGTRTVGFRTNASQLGWIRLNLGGFEGDIRYLAAAFNNTPGESIHVGSTAEVVPEPAAVTLVGLGLLALGARGVRRLREQREGTATDAR